jgi:hypothetical protein
LDVREGDVLCRVTRNRQSASDAATAADIERDMMNAAEKHAREMF